jgi:hypothetical protein
MRFEAEGIDAAIRLMQSQSARVRDMTPVFKAYGRWLEKQVDECFDQSVDWDGKKFPPLAESTIAGRIGNLGAANKRGKSGKLTKGAAVLRDKMRSPGGIKPLVDTARARNSQRFEADATGGLWTAVGYLGFHFAGNEHLPARNVSPFVPDGGGWTLHPKASSELEKRVGTFVATGGSGVEAAE